jgi:hypothetical protein
MFYTNRQSTIHPAGGVNETMLKGGNLCIRGTRKIEGKAVVGQQPVKIQCAFHEYDADISVQAIFSYKWLVDQKFTKHPLRYGLYFEEWKFRVFVSGLQGKIREHRPAWKRWLLIVCRRYP